ncbi:adenosylcobinamide-GDP ribazoletransferase [Shewanella pealeana]|uniref:Adenosylcobinamide-GDP ribazoletransferase n=1 Tax=Shewanella pealeana (strain ATCC 700345 / ANG-SQ1) TaxID=398579 RepID=COBS_SHEPA|nr:adenosylcobinamide-GDP ribazoletransferase [Shewanella pealeana]A8H806.1 RecName: Full=Adenosylcobinamide-GDP ribazoletransferase; AltName: Full=Cobalamin synthase; AltName: Full=Cobalamin-5'-phosphate synthase [Shewanella pealeana ATCC 700345]ABV88693.1 cobalamin 5'-phosphate synthase [Shewanella pealeana ATCC 700345]
MQAWQQQLNLFFIAMGFFTRIPMPKWIEVDADKLNKASRYFGLVGLLVGAISALVYTLMLYWVSPSIAIVLAMITSVLVTGGFHEDGLADTADGLGGGWTVEAKLNIMKDSRLGSYGALALVLALLLKWQLLTELALFDPSSVSLALIVGHCLSRVVAASFIFSEPYVSDSDTSKSKPLAQEQGINELSILLATGILALLLVGVMQALVLTLALTIVRYGFVRLFTKQIGGYTGDTLGAAQQGSELTCYLLLLVLGVSW